MVMPIKDKKLDGAAGAGAVGGLRPTAVPAPAAAAPELSDRPRRRTFCSRKVINSCPSMALCSGTATQQIAVYVVRGLPPTSAGRKPQRSTAQTWAVHLL